MRIIRHPCGCQQPSNSEYLDDYIKFCEPHAAEYAEAAKVSERWKQEAKERHD